MKNDMIVDYLNKEMISNENCKKFVLGSGLLMIWGIVLGIYLRSYWFYIGIVMFLVFAICACIIFIFASKELTLRRKILIQALVFVSWYYQIALLSAILFTYTYGINYKLIFLYLPSLVFCLFMFIVNSIMLRNRMFSQKQRASIKGLGFGFTATMIGWRLVSVLDNKSTEDATIPIILVGFTFINMLLSLGFLNFQKLYYLKKIEQGQSGDG